MVQDKEGLAAWLNRLHVDSSHVESEHLQRQLVTFSNYILGISRIDLSEVEPLFSCHQKGWNHG